MDSFRVAFFSALVLALPLATASANLQHQDSKPEDGVLSRYNQWSGFVRQYETPDGSILSEYSAQTTSDSVNGAILSVSLIPRFLCLPIVSVTVPNELASYQAPGAELMLVLDEQKMPFPFLPDKEDGQLRYTLNAGGQVHQNHRLVMDAASRASFQLKSLAPALSNLSASDVTMNGLPTLDFSLSGSRKTIRDMERLCKSHKPIPYDN